jgi:hypothetical protein
MCHIVVSTVNPFWHLNIVISFYVRLTCKRTSYKLMFGTGIITVSTSTATPAGSGVAVDCCTLGGV